jgi:hypothetical protein
LVADGTRRDTVDKTIALHHRAQTALGGVPFILAVNKADRSDEWAVDEGVLGELTQQGWAVIRTSAKSGDGVEEVFTRIAREMARG